MQCRFLSSQSQKVISKMQLRRHCASGPRARPSWTRSLVVVTAFEQQIYKRKDSLAAHSRYNHEFWRGYVGNWYINPHDPGHSDHRVIHGLRSLKWRDASRDVLDQVIVYDAYKAPAKQRDLDGLWQANSFFDHSQPYQDKEEVHVVPDDKTLHLLAVDSDCSGQVPFALPPVARGGKPAQWPGGQPGGQAPTPATAATAGAGTWGLELYLWDKGGHRWSASIVYDRATGDLSRLVMVQEAHTDIKPSTANVLTLAGARIPEARECLDNDEKSWLAPSSAGARVSIQADGQGGDLLMRSQGSEQVTWQPPSTTDHVDNVVMLLPDEMYVFTPVSLAMLAKDERNCARFEFGGFASRPATAAPPPAPGLFYENKSINKSQGHSSNGHNNGTGQTPVDPSRNGTGGSHAKAESKGPISSASKTSATAAGKAGAEAAAPGAKGGSAGLSFAFQRVIVDFDLNSGMLSSMVRERY